MSIKKTFNARAKKGISPVIATVILVAVAVVIAAALAGFASSLFGSYSSTGSAVTIQQASVSAADGSGQLSVHNSGNTSDEILSVAIDTFPAGTLDFDPAPDGTVAPNATVDVVLGNLDGGSDSLTAGDIVTMRVTMSSGLILSHSVIVSA
ncbi:archaellin/type IV pilin N-terminal domain-containing protein [Candidatus Nitrososphaera sp. FF02]|uniref:archaellin/type IV pilin N-terminal domain-containing protein n=1 Tax=Candidatus Nitrososphaera sp. FF02 TaxID=3398226 RepID=UPI0039E77875